MFYAGRDFLRQLNITEILQFNRYSHRSTFYRTAADHSLVQSSESDAAMRLLDADAKHSFCFYPAMDHDNLFDKTHQSTEFQAARHAGIECQKKLAPYANIQIQ